MDFMIIHPNMSWEAKVDSAQPLFQWENRVEKILIGIWSLRQ